MTVTIGQTTDIATCLALRRVVFMDEQGVSLEDEIDDLDEVSTHLIALEGTLHVGTARVYVTGDMAKISRVCVLKPCRGRGTGAALIRAALEVTRTTPGVSLARLGAQVDAQGFYRQLGFQAVGPVYDDAGIAHRDMVREV